MTATQLKNRPQWAIDPSGLAVQARRHGFEPAARDLDLALEAQEFIYSCNEARLRLDIDPNRYVNMELAFHQRRDPGMPTNPQVIREVIQEAGRPGELPSGVEPALVNAFLEMVSASWLEWRRTNRLKYRGECRHYHDPEDVCPEQRRWEELEQRLLHDLGWEDWAAGAAAP